MKPDEKYMPAFRKGDDGDMKFVPLKTTMDSSSPTMGWIPVFFFNNSGATTALPTNVGNQISIPNIANSINTLPLVPTNKITSNLPTSSVKTNENLNNYPDETNIDTLYSYNKINAMNMKNEISDTTNNKSTSTTRLIPSDLLWDFDSDIDEDLDLVRNCCNSNIDKIYKEIKENNSGIITILQSYGIPAPIIKLLVRRIAKISINYCDKE